MAYLLFATLVAIALASLYIYLQRIASYWKCRNVPSYGNIISGRFKETFDGKKSLTDVVTEFYLQTKDQNYVGTFMFGKPLLMVNNPEIIKRILLTDFNDFNSHGIYYDLKRDPTSGNLFSLAGADWKNMRTKLSPIFTSGKIKYMFNTVLGCIGKLDKVIDTKKPTVVDTLVTMSSLSMDVIASVAFGIEANCLENPNAEFGTMGRNINKGTFIAFIRFLILTNMHWLARLINLPALEKPVKNFFSTVIRDTVSYREKNNISRNDFLDLMIRLKNSGEIEGSLNAVGGLAKGVTLDEITAQAFIFFVAGFETTSQANTFTLLELAKNQDIQRRVQAECDQILKESNGQITFEALNGMEYTEKVLRETMRLYTGLQILVRSTIRKCKVPLTDIEVDKGTTIWIPLAALHRDPDCFPDPDKFDPERFSEENKKSIPPYMYMPFGDGPRICIGMRFALVQMKAVILYLLSKFNIDVVETTELEVKLDPRCYFPRPMGKFQLKFTPRENVPAVNL